MILGGPEDNQGVWQNQRYIIDVSLTRSFTDIQFIYRPNFVQGHFKRLTPISVEVENYEDAKAINALNEEVFNKVHPDDYAGLKTALQASPTVANLLTAYPKLYAFQVAKKPGIYARPWYVKPPVSILC